MQRTMTHEQLIAEVDHKARHLGIDEMIWDKFMTCLDALWAHDKATYLHSMRVGLYALGLSGRRAYSLPRLCLFGGCGHDFGKCHFSSEFINKAIFTNDDMKEIQSHTEYGWRDWVRFGYPATGMIARTHHMFQEKSYGVSADEMKKAFSGSSRSFFISSAETVAQADYFDALMTRGHRINALDSNEVHSHLVQAFSENSGKFDLFHDGEKEAISVANWLMENQIVDKGA